MRPIQVSASILSARFDELGNEIKAIDAAGADMIHLDVMDGHFVSNLTMGPDLVRALRPLTSLPFDMHIMGTPIEPLFDIFKDTGINRLSFHSDTARDVHKMIYEIRKANIQPGLALNPDQPVDRIESSLHLVDFVLVMSVFPGFAGASFLPEVLPKIRALSAIRQALALDFKIQVDGGINGVTAPLVVEAGADSLVSASYLFKEGPASYRHKIQTLKSISGPQR